jgi:hypothetical protein
MKVRRSDESARRSRVDDSGQPFTAAEVTAALGIDYAGVFLSKSEKHDDRTRTDLGQNLADFSKSDVPARDPK